MNRESWQFINTFAPWLAATGTIAAVIMSLHLARRSDRIRLFVTATIRVAVVEGGGADDGRELVWFDVTNCGRRSATVTQLFWRPVPWRRECLLLVSPLNEYSSPMPTTLRDGDQAQYAAPVAVFAKHFGPHAQRLFKGRAGWVRLQFLRFNVATSVGVTAGCRPKRLLRGGIRRMAQGLPMSSMSSNESK